jgi:hypothetical protein
MNFMNLKPFLLALALVTLCACVIKPRVYQITDYLPAGSKVEYYAQVDDGTWKSTLTMKSLPRPMHIKVAEKWALSAAQQRLGGLWRDYRFRVTPPGGQPVILWQRASTYNH